MRGAYAHILTHLRVDEILAGACLGLLYREDRKLPDCARSLSSYRARLDRLIKSIGWARSGQYVRPYASALLIFAALSLEHTRLGALLTSRIMTYIAAISYALYVIHHGLIQGWWNEGNVFERYLFKRQISFALTFLLSHLSTFYWERPWLDAAKVWIVRSRQVPTASSV